MTRRGSILLVVLGVIVLCALAAASALRTSNVSSWATWSSDRRLRSQLAAWSGVQAVMSQLASQRPRLLEGGAPELSDRFTAWESDGRRMEVRLLPLGKSLVASECGRLDLNRAPTEQLNKLPHFTPDLVSKIDQSRCTSLIGSVEELMHLGIAPEQLGWPLVNDENSDSTPPLAAVLSVFAVDSDEPTTASARSNPLCLCEPIDDAACQAINDAAGLDFCAVLKTRSQAGQPIAKRSDLARTAHASGVDAPHIGQLLELLSPSREAFRFGLVDINTSPAAVLACLPGIDAVAAGRLVEARERLSQADRANLLWPVIAGIVELDTYAPALDFLTVRSLVWRVRVEAGVLPPNTETAQSGADEAPLQDKTILEAVVDLSTPRPRVVYLRDVTHLAIASRLGDILPGPPPADQSAPEGEAPPPDVDGPGSVPGDAGTVSPPMGRVSRWSVPK